MILSHIYELHITIILIHSYNFSGWGANNSP